MNEQMIAPAPIAGDREENFSVARELARGYAVLVESYRRGWGITQAEADAKVRDVGDGAWLDQSLDAPPDELSWWNLSA